MQIPIVNEKDEIIGYKERNDRNPNDIIRITSIWITDEQGDILLAQRSFNKKDNPGKWGPAVAGTVEKDETYDSNAYKEAEEEIGLVGVLLQPIEKVFLDTSHTKKFCQLYHTEISKEREILLLKQKKLNKLNGLHGQNYKNIIMKNPRILWEHSKSSRNFLNKLCTSR